MDMAELASLRRLLWFQVNDPRCFLIKFADRLHNMRTIYALDPVKARFVAVETLQVWCYFAEQVGMFGAKAEMEDLSFATLDSETFRAVINARVDEWVLNEVDGRSADGGQGEKSRRCRHAAAARLPARGRDVRGGEIRGGGVRGGAFASARVDVGAADWSGRADVFRADHPG